MSQEPEDDTPAPKKKKGGKNKLLIPLVAVVVAAIAGGAGWYFAGRHKDADTPPAEAKAEPATPPVFVKLEVFTVNLRNTGGENHFLQTDITLKVKGPEVEAALKEQSPSVRNAILLLLSSKTMEDVSTVEGKQQLADQVIAAVNPLMPGGKPPAGAAPPAAPAAAPAAAPPAPPAPAAPAAPVPHDGPVQEVLFTTFIIQ